MNYKSRQRSLVLLLFIGLFAPQYGFAHFKTTSASPIQISDDGKLSYKSYPNGDRVPDFSFCGYKASEEVIPDIPVKVIVHPVDGDATALIQKAIDYVSSLPVDVHGFRGTVLLGKGTYNLNGSLLIKTSGIVLRGSGCGEEGTILTGKGTDRETLIRIAGVNNKGVDKPVKLSDTYFPVNTTVLTFANAHSFKVGDRVLVNRPSTKEWLEKLGTDKIGIYVDYTLTKWEPGDFDLNWYRTIVAVTPTSITLDVPLPNSLDPQYGGGTVATYRWEGQIHNVGIENLSCTSTYKSSNLKDENHRWMAITLENVSDAWVRRIVARNFVSSAVAVWETAQRVTVEDCKSLSPVGEIGGYRRYAFQTLGQQTLFQRCYAEYAYHAFSTGFTVCGPNAFVQCYSYMPYNFSGAVGGWANGVLFDKMTVDGGIISFGYRDVDGQGGGWSTANSLCWQCRAAQIRLPAPPTAQNWAYGSWAQGYGDGHHELQHTFVKPESFYYAQLEARTGSKQAETDKILINRTEETTAPSIEYAAAMSKRSLAPDVTMNDWIDSMVIRYPIHNDLSAAKNIDEIRTKNSSILPAKAPSFSIFNGRIVQGGAVVTGKRERTSMWKGTTRPSDLAKAAPNLVRFVPGRIGRGLIDDLDTVAADMLKNNVVMMQNFPALWYERRRDDHARTRRADADVWAPFYEQPFSRSGQGEAFDRLSRYDLTEWNTWYWLRLKKFADIADRKGVLFLEEHYLQHNIIEEGAHWADYPWRTANNINNTGFAENPPYAGDKRVYMAEQFYDTANLVRKALHKAYIRKSLDEFKDNDNIIHHLGSEFSGPIHFVKYWLDQIADWEKVNHKKVMVMLPGTKDVQDAILADPKYARLVDIIDVTQWQYRKDGSLYAPPGGVSLTDRQYSRLYDVGETSFQQIYRAVSEFRINHPDKAIVYSRGGGRSSGWAVFMGGGSLAAIPPVKDKLFLNEAAVLEIVKPIHAVANQYTLGKAGLGYIIYSESGTVVADLSGDKADYSVKWVNPANGIVTVMKEKIERDKVNTLKAPFEGAAVLWLSKK